MRLQHAVTIEDDTQVGEARRLAAGFCASAGLSDTEAGRAAIAVTELGTNIRKHAGRGELLLRHAQHGDRFGVEVMAVDRGPGMEVSVALRDGQSTAGTRGEGLGAVKRVSDEFDAFSQPGHGAVVLSRIWPGGAPHAVAQVGAVCLPLAGERECGDNWDCAGSASVLRVLVADGLGHGPLAARASSSATASFKEPATQQKAGPQAMLHVIHAALRSTRGAAVGIAELDLIARTLRFGGIGNIAAILDGGAGKARGLLSHNGIAGHEAPRIQEFTLPWPVRAVLVVHSDGLTGHWKLADYPGLHLRHAAVIAAVLYRDFRRKTDDTTVVVIKEP